MDNVEAQAIRVRLGLTQAQLAEVVGYATPLSISEFERATNPKPVPRLLALLLKAYDDGYRPANWPKRTTARRVET